MCAKAELCDGNIIERRVLGNGEIEVTSKLMFCMRVSCRWERREEFKERVKQGTMSSYWIERIS